MVMTSTAHRAGLGLAALATLIALAGCTGNSGGGKPEPSPSVTATVAAGAVPRPEHIVVVIEENHSYSDIIGSADAPYLNSLAASGASFTASFAVTHPSEPNYLSLFSGWSQGLTDDSCPHTFTGANLASQLTAAGLTFTGYSEGLPNPGDTGCATGGYARKHNPWSDFPSVPAKDSQPLSAFPTDYARLPTVSFLVPDLNDDMHDGTVTQGDTWLREHLDSYRHWAATHHSLLIVTWDEDDNSASNRIPTIITGQPVLPGKYSQRINHYAVLRTLQAAYGLPALGASASATAITGCWTT